MKLKMVFLLSPILNSVVMLSCRTSLSSERASECTTLHIHHTSVGTVSVLLSTRVPVSGTNTCTVAVEVTRAVSCDREYVQRVVR